MVGAFFMRRLSKAQREHAGSASRTPAVYSVQYPPSTTTSDPVM
jgi:hypothetical protein